MKTPLSLVKDQFGDKEKLVAAVEKFTSEDLWVNKTNKNKGLAHVSNSKLLHLHATFSTVKEKFGTRAKLIDAIVDLEKRTKDEGFKTRLSAYPVPRLYDMYRATAKRNGVKPAATKAAKAPRAAKPASAGELKAPKASKSEKKIPAKK